VNFRFAAYSAAGRGPVQPLSRLGSRPRLVNDRWLVPISTPSTPIYSIMLSEAERQERRSPTRLTWALIAVCWASVAGALEWPFCALPVLLGWPADHMPGCGENGNLRQTGR
jgi:hypothetical protein